MVAVIFRTQRLGIYVVEVSLSQCVICDFPSAEPEESPHIL
jgi:hypothetical protein